MALKKVCCYDLRSHKWLSLGTICLGFSLAAGLAASRMQTSPQDSNNDQDRKEPLLSGETFDHWFSTQRFDPGNGYVIQGPSVLRSRGNPAFFWQINSVRDWNVKSDIPYIIVAADLDSMRLLTSFSTVPASWEPKISSSGSIQSDEFYTRFEYEFGLGDDDGDTKILEERIDFQCASADRSFDLEKGRIFLIRKNHDAVGFVVEQIDSPMPPLELFESLHTMAPHKQQIYGRFHQWLNQLIGK